MIFISDVTFFTVMLLVQSITIRLTGVSTPHAEEFCIEESFIKIMLTSVVEEYLSPTTNISSLDGIINAL